MTTETVALIIYFVGGFALGIIFTKIRREWKRK